MTSLRPNVLAAKERLAEGEAAFRRRHVEGCAGVELCAAISDLRDEVLLGLTEAALADLGEAGPNGLWPEIALVAHAGYGRRDVAPYSDVDLMILHAPGLGGRVAPLAERLLRDVFDAGLIVGHSVRTPEQACRMACNEPMICTSLVESRLLGGSQPLFAAYKDRLLRQARRRARWLMAGIEKDRRQERLRYGETVFLLEPNVKRSRGGLRDVQLIRWLGLVRYGTADLDRLHLLGKLHEEDVTRDSRAAEFLLRLRNEMHFHAGHAADVLDRAEQLRIAEFRGYQPAAGLLPVEQFMRDYFRHSDAVSHIAARFAANAQSSGRKERLVTITFGHRVEDGVHVGPAGLLASGGGLRMLHGNLTAIMRLVDLANLYDVPVAASTWEAIRHQAARLPPSRRRPRPAAIFSRCWPIPLGWRRCYGTCTPPACWNGSSPSSSTPADCCNSISITNTRSMSIVCGRWSLPRSLPPIRDQSAGFTGRLRRSTCCIWRCCFTISARGGWRIIARRGCKSPPTRPPGWDFRPTKPSRCGSSSTNTCS